ncbi:MAG: M48 family metalloprotease [Phascolarctobacterium sp.]|nr:M48 family metalloprotease [Phascolarctobacterium sp.]
MRKGFAKTTLAAVAALTILTGSLKPAVTEASGILGNVIGSVISGAVAMNQINAQIKELDNDKRYEFYQQLQEKNGVNYDTRANAQLDRVMNRLTRVIVNYDPTVRTKPYNYFVNNDRSFNAFCTLGHNVSVNIGLFEALNYQEDEVAFVLGHELSHGTHSDPANGVKKQVGMQVLTSIAASSVGGGSLASLGAAVIGNVGTAKGITLPMEKRADEDAFVYCSEAGYNVGAGAAVWQRIIDSTSKKEDATSKINQLFNPSDHPKHVNRRDTYIKTITQYSNNMVTVDNKTGEISVNKVKIGTPAAAFGQSACERAYMVAGDIASIYHNNGKIRPRAYASNGYVYLGNTAILTITSGDNASQWVNNLNTANRGK